MIVAMSPGARDAAMRSSALGSRARCSAPRAITRSNVLSPAPRGVAASIGMNARSAGSRPETERSFASWAGVDGIAALASECWRMKPHWSAVRVG